MSIKKFCSIIGLADPFFEHEFQGRSTKIEIFSKTIFEKPPIAKMYGFRIITEKSKNRGRDTSLGNIINFNLLGSMKHSWWVLG